MFNIAVIGCGTIGLTSAVAIQKKLKDKATVTVFSKDFSPNTTGDIAAGLWTPYLVQNTPHENIIKWSKSTHDYLMKLWKEGKAKEYGISLQTMYKFTDKENFEIPEWTKITLGFHMFTDEELYKFNDKYKKNITAGCSFVCFVWEASIFLPYLQEKFANAGGIIVKKEITDFEELSGFDLIVNCAGLNSKYLTNDDKVVPIRGQVLRVNAPWQYHTLVLNIGEGNYIIPNKECVILGGTHQEGDYNCEISDIDRHHIINGCHAFVPSLRTAEVIKHAVGLRPARDQVKLEIERKLTARGKSQYIVHNYGHGGSGITLSIGCAEDAAELAEKAMTLSKSKL